MDAGSQFTRKFIFNPLRGLFTGYVEGFVQETQWNTNLNVEEKSGVCGCFVKRVEKNRRKKMIDNLIFINLFSEFNMLCLEVYDFCL